MKFVGREVIASFKKSAEDGVPLRGLLEPDTLQMFMKDLLGFTDHLERDGGLVIDAFVEHVGPKEAGATRSG
jgi:hypothetical protein